MSRWWRERVRVGLAPTRVELLRHGMLPRRKPHDERVLGCAPRPGQPPWAAAVEALDGAIGEFGARGDSAVVVLSNHLVRYLVLPWQPDVTGAAETETLARVRFENTYGAAVAGWTIRVADGAWGEARVACAVDSGLIEALRGIMASRGLRLDSVQPLLMAAYNDLRSGFHGATALAIVEAGRVCLSVFDHDRWLGVAARRWDGDPAETVLQELATLDATAVPAAVDVVLVGEDVTWNDSGALPAHLVGGDGARRSLAPVGDR